MTLRLESAVLPLLRRLDAETAHSLALRALRYGLLRGDSTPDDPALGITVLGRHFPNPIGLAAALAPFADYTVINVSSPNTPGLRDLQGEAQLRAILEAVATVPNRPPLLVKIAPDLAEDALPALVETCVDAGVQGLIVSNTTITRPAGLRSPRAHETGGLSGPPLFALSTRMLARAHLLARGRLTLIGVGGVASGSDALTKIRAGASLVQLYTAFAFAGPALIPRIKHELVEGLRRAGFARIQDAIGSDATQLAGLA